MGPTVLVSGAGIAGSALAHLLARRGFRPTLVERSGKLGDAGWRSRELLDHLRGVDDFYFDAVSRVRLAHWSRGRVVLLGDAASCVSFLGGGSSNALAGAGVLADALAAHPGDPETAFVGYESTHRKRVDPKQRGVVFGSHLLVPANAVEIAVRNTLLRVWSSLRGASSTASGAYVA